MFLMVVMSHSGMLPSLLLLGCSPLTLSEYYDHTESSGSGENASLPQCPNESSGDLATHEGLWDKCDYGYCWRCGDKCRIRMIEDLCDCGGTILRWELYPTKHCCTSTNCTQSLGRVSCPRGQVLDISEPCEGRCHGGGYYISSQHLSYYADRYSCSGERKDCLPLRDMCQGLSSCGESQKCNKELRCGISFRQFPHSSGKIKTLNTSQVKHSFCQYHWNKGDRSYSSIDRSDENIINTINIKESPKIDYSYLKPCNNSKTNSSGVTCYETANKLDRPPCNSVSFEWCRSDLQSSCVTSQDGTRTVTDDSRLCSNKTFWRNIRTDHYNNSGVRCNGTVLSRIIQFNYSKN